MTSYFGKASQSRTARARLLGLMSKYGWTLWASIQHATSELDFDFWEWGMEKYDRAVEEFDDPGFRNAARDRGGARLTKQPQRLAPPQPKSVTHQTPKGSNP